MNLILEKVIDENTHYDVFKKRGVDFFVDSIPKISYQNKNNELLISGICQKNKSSVVFDKNLNFVKSSCDCDAYKNYKGFCKHIIAILYEYNYQQIINNISNLKDINDYELTLLVDIFNNKVILSPQFLIYKKQHEIIDVNQIISGNQLEIRSKQETIKLDKQYLNQEIFELFNNLINVKKNIKIFNNKSFLVDQNCFIDFLEFCFNNKIKLLNEKDKSELVSIKYINKENLLYTKLKELFFNKNITIKRNYNDLFYCKTDFLISDHYCESNKSVFFLTNPIDKYSLVHIVNSNDSYNDCKNFYWRINHGVSKGDFFDLYNYVNNNFSEFNLSFDEVAIKKNNLLNQDPLLSLELTFHEEINNPVVILKYVYHDDYYYYDDNQNDLSNRQLEKENKLFKRVEKIIGIFNSKYKCFTFDSQEDFLKIVKWMTLNKNNENYIFKIAKNLIYKQKAKTRFSISGINSRDDLLYVNWKLANYSNEDTKEIIKSYIKKNEFVKLSNGEIINLLKDIDFDDFENQLKLFNATFNDYIEDNVIAKKWNYPLLYNQFKDQKEIKEFVDSFQNIKDIELNLSEHLNSILKPYQIYGVQWLKLHHRLSTGSILADEMGLGKTLQSITFLSDLYNENPLAKSIVVTPSSLVYNWKKEFEQFAPNLKICVIDGNVERRGFLLKNIKNYDIVIVSYNLLKIDINNFNNINFDIVIIDEGHTIKNHFTKFAKAIKSLNSKHKIALTGTPMENNALELWSLFDFIMPGFLNDFNSFKKMIAISDEFLYKTFKNKISPFILRRTKTDVLKELPEKTEKVMYIDFSDEQKTLYLNLLDSIRKDIDKSILIKDIEKNKIFILSLLTKLRQLCCSPKLLYENAKTNGTKFDMCLTLINEIIEKGEKVLVFSQFTEMINLLQSELYKQNISHSVITGSTPKKQRQILVDEFNKDKNNKVFLISLKAGGVGLNLTSASNVIHYDLWWNVSVENQASDRAHRIGQKNNVTIYKLVMNDSIEEKIIDIQNVKKDLINKILDFSKINGENFSMKEMLSLLNIKDFT